MCRHGVLSAGAVSYTAEAVSASGHVVSCLTNDTICELERLACGDSYSVSVQADGESCSSLAHMSGQLVTGEDRTLPQPST